MEKDEKAMESQIESFIKDSQDESNWVHPEVIERSEITIVEKEES